jgi:N-acetylglucosamine kinase-like BadF-type ATPase
MPPNFTDPPSRPIRPDLVLGIDGGGTHTAAILARRDTGDVIGRGTGGPSNIQSVGVSAAMKGLDEAVDRAFRAAGLAGVTVGSACLGLAGIDRNEGVDVIRGWADWVALAGTLTVANDATLLLAAGTPLGWGLAVVCGTGSIAFVQTADGQVGRCGGWGYTLGDEGSGYQIALAGLRAVCRAFDRCSPETTLTATFLQRMGLGEVPDLIPAVYRGPWDRAAVSGLAPVVLDAADSGDEVAGRIVRREASELAITAAAAVRNHGLPTVLPLALTGGVVLRSEPYRAAFLGGLREQGVTPDPIGLVSDPGLGAVVLARRAVVA